MLAFEGDEIVGSINDGERWSPGLGLLPRCFADLAAQRVARALMVQAEQWMCVRGVPKMHAMIRHDNLEVRSFYTALGYADDDVLVVEKFLNGQSENLNARCFF